MDATTEQHPSQLTSPPTWLVGGTLALEEATALDAAVHGIEPTIRKVFGTGTRGAALRGDWLGHALHPLVTDVTLGAWTSATVLDLVGGAGARRSAQILVGTGLLTAGPTAWTGWAQWAESDQREKRVGLVHAVTNGAAIGAYAASYASRRRGRHARGVGWALAGAALTSVGGYLGGHLVTTRKVATHDPAYD